jgi:stearoyl-CoA desaturase (Delta-9 desaturase)
MDKSGVAAAVTMRESRTEGVPLFSLKRTVEAGYGGAFALLNVRSLFKLIKAKYVGSAVSRLSARNRRLIESLGDDCEFGNVHGQSGSNKLHAHLTWMVRHDYPNVTHYVPDLLRDKTVARFNRRYYLWVALGLALPAVVGGLAGLSLAGALTGLLWGGVVRLFVVEPRCRRSIRSAI